MRKDSIHESNFQAIIASCDKIVPTLVQHRPNYVSESGESVIVDSRDPALGLIVDPLVLAFLRIVDRTFGDYVKRVECHDPTLNRTVTCFNLTGSVRCLSVPEILQTLFGLSVDMWRIILHQQRRADTFGSDMPNVSNESLGPKFMATWLQRIRSLVQDPPASHAAIIEAALPALPPSDSSFSYEDLSYVGPVSPTVHIAAIRFHPSETGTAIAEHFRRLMEPPWSYNVECCECTHDETYFSVTTTLGASKRLQGPHSLVVPRGHWMVIQIHSDTGEAFVHTVPHTEKGGFVDLFNPTLSGMSQKQAMKSALEGKLITRAAWSIGKLPYRLNSTVLSAYAPVRPPCEPIIGIVRRVRVERIDGSHNTIARLCELVSLHGVHTMPIDWDDEGLAAKTVNLEYTHTKDDLQAMDYMALLEFDDFVK